MRCSYDAIFARIAEAPADRPYVVGQIGQSLDGRIATSTGHSHYINGPAALDHLHRLRASVDAVVVGVNTILQDDPQLTVRRCSGDHPQRVVIDLHDRMPQSARCRNDQGPRPLRITTKSDARDDNCILLEADTATGQVSPHCITAALFDRGFHRILIEGGAATLSGFIGARAMNRLHILMAPMLIGSGLPGLTLPPIENLSEAIRPEIDVVPLGDGDWLIDCCLTNPLVDKPSSTP